MDTKQTNKFGKVNFNVVCGDKLKSITHGLSPEDKKADEIVRTLQTHFNRGISEMLPLLKEPPLMAYDFETAKQYPLPKYVELLGNREVQLKKNIEELNKLVADYKEAQSHYLTELDARGKDVQYWLDKYNLLSNLRSALETELKSSKELTESLQNIKLTLEDNLILANKRSETQKITITEMQATNDHLVKKYQTLLDDYEALLGDNGKLYRKLKYPTLLEIIFEYPKKFIYNLFKRRTPVN